MKDGDAWVSAFIGTMVSNIVIFGLALYLIQ
jgi:hypothetical protein